MKLLQLRKTVPAITEGKVISQMTRDDLGLICVTRQHQDQQVTLVFCSRDVTVTLPQLAGKQDLLTGEVFSGKFEGVTAMVLQ